jgi:hypothetical protein
LTPTRSDLRRRAALFGALWALAAAPRALAQVPAEYRVRCQLLSFRVLQADKGGLTDGRFAQGFDETTQRAALHSALAALPQLDMIALGADTALVRRSDLATRRGLSHPGVDRQH